ncbi:50S ribosomal protein L31 [Patescibacteria group bacterium]|nr:50S ribosomal protein L31 [Patescibacteria group bacterium]
MKKEIHPQYHKNAKITCACGASYNVGSTVPEIEVEICSHCHPFYSGKQKLVDTARRVDRFKKMSLKSEEMKKAKKPKAVRTKKEK